MSVHRHAQTMLAEAQAAREWWTGSVRSLAVSVRVSVPVEVAQTQLPRSCRLPDKYPKVRLQLHVSNRRVDLINEG